MSCNQIRRAFSKGTFPRFTRPSTNLAVRDERQATEVIDPSGMPEISQQILKAEPQMKFLIHVAVQHRWRN